MNLGEEPLLTPGEVAKLFRVDPKTVARWAKSGRLKAHWTLGGHRRFLRSDIQAAIDDVQQRRTPTDAGT